MLNRRVAPVTWGVISEVSGGLIQVSLERLKISAMKGSVAAPDLPLILEDRKVDRQRYCTGIISRLLVAVEKVWLEWVEVLRNWRIART